MWVPTAPNPPHSLVFALCWCPHTWGRFIVCLNLQLRPAPSPNTLSVCTTAFPFKVFHTAPSLSCLMGKSLCNAASETQIPITYRESKCLHLQNQWASVLVASWRMPAPLPRHKVICPVWQIRGARHTGMCEMLLKMLLPCFVWVTSLLAQSYRVCRGKCSRAVAQGRFAKGARRELPSMDTPTRVCTQGVYLGSHHPQSAQSAVSSQSVPGRRGCRKESLTHLHLCGGFKVKPTTTCK